MHRKQFAKRYGSCHNGSENRGFKGRYYRILDADEKLIGVLDFNNMIPVRADVLMEVDLKIHPKDSQEIKRYKNLMIDQLNFCRQNQDILV